jgi:mannan endo-1,4-beta-mannosidase
MTNWKKPEMKIKILAAIFLAATVSVFAAETPLQNFITARGAKLFDGTNEFRFISWNIPNLLLVEDNYPFAEKNAWRLPDQFEITDVLATVRQMGGTVVRTYSISVVRGDNPPASASHVLAPGKFNEDAFVILDRALKTAGEQGVRLVIPLVNNWPWMGGRGEYAGFRGKTANDFWTDPQLIADFKQTIYFVLTRTNTLTGVRYCDDKSILCWETGNELQSPASWTREISRYIKSLDTNHLVMDGNTGGIRSGSLDIPDVDIVTTHHYPGGRNQRTFAQSIRQNAELAKGKKPYVVGEFGFVSTEQMAGAMQAIRETGISGGLLWSLRFHDRDGGFYWHSEPAGGNVFKAFHWPGSEVANAYDEKNLMAITRTNAFAIRRLPVPEIPIPAPPKLLPISDAGEISWQGSVGAANYIVERAPKIDGSWTIAGENIDESSTQYHPLFSDESAPTGNWFYRVRAKNDSGISEPSNIVGPVAVTQITFVDELADLKKVFAAQGNFATKLTDSRKAKEDAQRAAGNSGDALTYQLPNSVTGFRVFAYFPNDVADLKFSVSSDGKDFQEVKAGKENYYAGAGDYNYWQPVIYHAEKIPARGTFLKIELTGETQIGRVEIIHAAGKN